MTSNREGLPGEPGEQGTDTHGGHGGAGGHGGMGERVHYRTLIVYVLIITIVLSVGTAIALKKISDNTDSIKDLEKSDVVILKHADSARDAAIVAIRKTEYRLCIRSQITRVALNLDKDHDEPTLPLYDCTPDLTGGQAKLLTPKQAEAFTAKVKADHFKP